MSIQGYQLEKIIASYKECNYNDYWGCMNCFYKDEICFQKVKNNSYDEYLEIYNKYIKESV